MAGVTLKNISIDAPLGLTIGYPEVVATQVEVHAASGPAITKLAGAAVPARSIAP